MQFAAAKKTVAAFLKRFIECQERFVECEFLKSSNSIRANKEYAICHAVCKPSTTRLVYIKTQTLALSRSPVVGYSGISSVDLLFVDLVDLSWPSSSDKAEDHPLQRKGKAMYKVPKQPSVSYAAAMVTNTTSSDKIVTCATFASHKLSVSVRYRSVIKGNHQLKNSQF